MSASLTNIPEAVLFNNGGENSAATNRKPSQ